MDCILLFSVCMIRRGFLDHRLANLFRNDLTRGKRRFNGLVRKFRQSNLIAIAAANKMDSTVLHKPVECMIVCPQMDFLNHVDQLRCLEDLLLFLDRRI